MNGHDPKVHHHTDRVRNTIAIALILAFVGTIPLLVWKTIPGGNKETIVYIIGQLSGMATTALAFYFTTKVGQEQQEHKKLVVDEKRAEASGKMADAIVAAAGAGTSTSTDATHAAEQAAEETAQAATDKAEEFRGKPPPS